MRPGQWIISLFLATSLCAASAMAADAAPASNLSGNKLEKIDAAPAAQHNMKDCPMHQGKKECDHKKGEPCPYHQDAKHHGKSHEKCEHEHRS